MAGVRAKPLDCLSMRGGMPGLTAADRSRRGDICARFSRRPMSGHPELPAALSIESRCLRLGEPDQHVQTGQIGDANHESRSCTWFASLHQNPCMPIRRGTYLLEAFVQVRHRRCQILDMPNFGLRRTPNMQCCAGPSISVACEMAWDVRWSSCQHERRHARCVEACECSFLQFTHEWTGLPQWIGHDGLSDVLHTKQSRFVLFHAR